MPETTRHRQGYAPGGPSYPGGPQGQRRRRAERAAAGAGKAGQLIRAAASLLVLLLLLGLGLSWRGYQRAAERLRQHRQEKAAVLAKREQDMQDYAAMRQRSGYLALIQASAEEFQLEPAFISAIIARESSYRKDAMAPSTGALGLMQLMEGTGKWVAERLGVPDYRYDRLREPELNIRFGCWFLSYLSAQFGGDPVMVAAAYHAGPDNVKHWAMNYGADQKRITIDQIPKDNTRYYVKEVMNAYALYYAYDQRQ